LAIDAISCSCSFLNASEIQELDDSYLFSVNLQALNLDAKCQQLFCLSSKTGNGSGIQQPFDQIVTMVKTHMPVLGLSFDGDPSYNCRHNNFSSGGSRVIQEMGEISTSC
jgi:hypothetical protein